MYYKSWRCVTILRSCGTHVDRKCIFGLERLLDEEKKKKFFREYSVSLWCNSSQETPRRWIWCNRILQRLLRPASGLKKNGRWRPWTGKFPSVFSVSLLNSDAAWMFSKEGKTGPEEPMSQIQRRACDCQCRTTGYSVIIRLPIIGPHLGQCIWRR